MSGEVAVLDFSQQVIFVFAEKAQRTFLCPFQVPATIQLAQLFAKEETAAQHIPL
jgi:hypothetical protein